MNTQTESTITTDQISAFHNALVRGRDALQEAGNILVEMLDADPTVKERILSAHPDITEDTLATFERIGRRQLYYKLCLNEAPGIRALRRCPYSEQVKYADEPVPMLLVHDGKPDELAVAVNTMSREQAKQVFAASRVRTMAEQRTWIQANKPRARVVEVDRGYTVHGGKVTFNESVTMSASDLARLLAEIA